MPNADFEQQLKAAVDRMRGKAERVTRAFALTVFNEIQTGGQYSPGTPVANPASWPSYQARLDRWKASRSTRPAPQPAKHVGGFARANWQASLGAPVSSDLDPAIAGQPEAEAAAAMSVARNQDTIAQFRLGDVAYLNNNAPYIQRLEYGWSQQAPVGMVRETLRHAQAILDEIAAHLDGGSHGR